MNIPPQPFHHRNFDLLSLDSPYDPSGASRLGITVCAPIVHYRPFDSADGGYEAEDLAEGEEEQATAEPEGTSLKRAADEAEATVLSPPQESTEESPALIRPEPDSTAATYLSPPHPQEAGSSLARPAAAEQVADQAVPENPDPRLEEPQQPDPARDSIHTPEPPAPAVPPNTKTQTQTPEAPDIAAPESPQAPLVTILTAEELHESADALATLVQESLSVPDTPEGEETHAYVTAALVDGSINAETVVALDETDTPVGALTVKQYSAEGKGSSVWQGADPDFMERAQAWADEHEVPLQATYVQAAVVREDHQGQGIGSELLQTAEAETMPVVVTGVTRNPHYAQMQATALGEEYRTFVGGNHEITPGREGESTDHHGVALPWLEAFTAVPGTTVYTDDMMLSGAPLGHEPVDTSKLSGPLKTVFDRFNEIQQQAGPDSAGVVVFSVRTKLLSPEQIKAVGGGSPESDDPSRQDPEVEQPSEQSETAEQRLQAEIDTYLGRPPLVAQGDTTAIPTVNGPVGYTKNSSGFTASDHRFYKLALGDDEYTVISIETFEGENVVRMIGKDPNATPIAGGLTGSIGGDNVVLDIGSGQARALHELARAHPGVYIGLDADYDREVPIDITKKGVQLTKGDWKDLAAIPDESIDTGFAHFSVILWTDTPEESVAALTRVFKPGGSLRFPAGNLEDSPYPMRELLEESGWEVTIAGETAIAVKSSAESPKK